MRDYIKRALCTWASIKLKSVNFYFLRQTVKFNYHQKFSCHTVSYIITFTSLYIIGLWLLFGANTIVMLPIWMHFCEAIDFLADPYY